MGVHFVIPYDFVLQWLYPVRVEVKKRLNGYFLYHNGRLLMFLRDAEDFPEFNGIFIATQPQYFDSLSNDVHRSRMEFDLDSTKDSWIFISEDLEDFEAKVQKACDLIKANDERMGRPA